MYTITNVRIIFIAFLFIMSVSVYLLRGIYMRVPINTIYNMEKQSVFIFKFSFFHSGARIKQMYTISY